jgi:DNA repair exonuclease SbcCD ATPase subunit
MNGWGVLLIIGIILGLLLVGSMATEFGDMEQELSQAATAQDAAESEVESAKFALETVYNQLAEKDSLIQTLTTERNQAQADSAAATAKVDELTGQVTSLKNQVSELTQKAQTAQQNLDSQTANLGQLNQDNQTLQSQLEQTQRELALQQGLAKDVMEVNQRLALENQSYSQTIQDYNMPEGQQQAGPVLIPVTSSPAEGQTTNALSMVGSLMVGMVAVYIFSGLGVRAGFLPRSVKMQVTREEAQEILRKRRARQ